MRSGRVFSYFSEHFFLLHIPMEAGSCWRREGRGSLVYPSALLCGVPKCLQLGGCLQRTLILTDPEGSSDPLPHQPSNSSCLWLWGRVSATLLRLDSSSFIRRLVVAPEFFCYTLSLHSFIPFFLLFTYYRNGIRKNKLFSINYIRAWTLPRSFSVYLFVLSSHRNKWCHCSKDSRLECVESTDCVTSDSYSAFDSVASQC